MMRRHLLELAVEAADLGLWWLSLEADTLKGSPRCRRIIGFPSEAPLSYRPRRALERVGLQAQPPQAEIRGLDGELEQVGALLEPSRARRR
jgi:hypothetical protein